MAILDTFVLLFQSDASQLDKGLDDSRKKAKDAAKEISVADDAAGKLGRSIGSALRDLGGALAGALAVRALAQSFNEATTYADKLDETAERLDVNIETLSAYGDAVKLAGGSLEGLTGSVENLNASLSAMEVTGKSRAAPFLKELGIDMDDAANKGKTAFELLPQIAAAMDGMGKQQSAAIGKKLGLDAGTIMLLQQGGKNLDELIAKSKALGVVTKQQGEVAAAYNDQLDNTRHALRSIWLELSTAVLPILTWFTKKIEEGLTFMRQNKDLFVGVFIAIGAAIAYFALPPLLALIAAAAIAAAPFLLLGAIIAGVALAFGLLYDDIMNFIEGNDSLIGQFLDEYPQVKAVLEGIGDVFMWLASVAKDVAEIIWTVFGRVFESLGIIVGEILGFWVEKLAVVGEVFTALGAVVGGIFQYWIDMISQFLAQFGGIVGIAKSVGGAISGALGAVKGALGISVTGEPGAAPADGEQAGPMQAPRGAGASIPGLAEGKSTLGAISASPIGTQSAAATAARTTNKTTTVQIDKVEVQTQATDAAGISKGIGDTLGTQLRQAASNYDDGVAA